MPQALTPQEAGTQFVQSVINRLPEDARASLQTLVESTPELAIALGEGTLRQDEFSRRLDAVNTRATEQQTWWEANQPLAALGAKAKELGFDPARTTPPPASGLTTPALPDDVVRREDLTREAGEFASFTMGIQQLGLNHFKEFGEVLDLQALAADPRAKTIGIRGVYEASVATRRAEAQKVARDVEVAKLVEEGVKTRLREGGNPNFPSSRAIPAGSPLDALEPVKSTGAGVDELVDEYNALVAAGSVRT